MTFGRLLTNPATVHRRVLDHRDEAGDEVYVDVDHDTRCHLAQTRRDEGSAGALQSEDHIAFFPTGLPITGWDAVTIDGRRFEVAGPPWVARNARTGADHHIEATLRRTV